MAKSRKSKGNTTTCNKRSSAAAEALVRQLTKDKAELQRQVFLMQKSILEEKNIPFMKGEVERSCDFTTSFQVQVPPRVPKTVTDLDSSTSCRAGYKAHLSDTKKSILSSTSPICSETNSSTGLAVEQAGKNALSPSHEIGEGGSIAQHEFLERGQEPGFGAFIWGWICRVGFAAVLWVRSLYFDSAC